MDIVKRNKIVFLDLIITTAEGELVDTTAEGGEFSYLHGRGNLLPAVEDAVNGQPAGFSTSVTVPPADAFGYYLDDLITEVPRNSFSPEVSLTAGEPVQFNGPDGIVAMTIIDFNDDQVTLDGNHPLAGKTLTFDLTVKAIRDAHKDEVKHRRPHPAGHHLMVSDSSVYDTENLD